MIIILLLTLNGQQTVTINVTLWLLGESNAKGRMAGKKMCSDREGYFACFYNQNNAREI